MPQLAFHAACGPSDAYVVYDLTSAKPEKLSLHPEGT